MPKFKYVVVACARWETQYICEWIAYYKEIKFDHIYLYCNDDDPTDFARVVASSSISNYFVTLRHFSGQGQQYAMYRHAMATVGTEAEWVTFIDIDEFLVLRGTNDIHAFMNRFQREIDCVHFNWLMFGNNYFVDRPAGSVLRQYTKRSAFLDVHTKHISRTAMLTAEKLDAARFPFWHGLENPAWDGMRRVNVLGDDWENYADNFPRNSERFLAIPGVVDRIIATATVHHYVFKSEMDFHLRVQRGIAGQFRGQIKWAELYRRDKHKRVLYDLSQVKDTYLREFSEATHLGTKTGDMTESSP